MHSEKIESFTYDVFAALVLILSPPGPPCLLANMFDVSARNVAQSFPQLKGGREMHACPKTVKLQSEGRAVSTVTEPPII